MHTVKDRHPPLFSPAKGSMQLSCGSLTLWGLRTSSWTVSTFLGERLMLMMMVT